MNARGKVPLAVGWYQKISLETQVACEFLWKCVLKCDYTASLCDEQTEHEGQVWPTIIGDLGIDTV